MTDRQIAFLDAYQTARAETAERRRLEQIETLDREIARLTQMRDRLAGDQTMSEPSEHVVFSDGETFTLDEFEALFEAEE